MTVLASAADTRSAEFRANAERMRALLDQLSERTAEAARGGPESARQRHLGRDPRELRRSDLLSEPP